MHWKRLTACLLTFALIAGLPAAAAESQRSSPESHSVESSSVESLLEQAETEESTPESDPMSGTEEPAPSAPAEEPAQSEAAEELPEEEKNAPEEKSGESICASVGDLLETEAHGAYLAGYSDGTFRPSGKITRAEAAKLFYNLLKEEPALTASFTDVPENGWYGPAVRALASLGAIKGYADETFRPGNNITRAEFVSIAARFSTVLPGTAAFSDVGDNHWARAAIASAVAHGWVNGYPNGSFRPGANITRAEAVQIINAMLGRSPDEYVKTIYYTVEFDDVARSHWAYGQISEAATPHEYTVENGIEHWSLPDRYDGTGWVLSQGMIRYEDPENGGFLSGFHPVGGYTYYFDPETSEVQTGWQTIGGKHYLLPSMDEAENALTVHELLTETNFTPSGRSFGDIEYITVHYTAVPNDTAKSECQYFETAYRGASAGYFVDEEGIWRCVADRDVSWHCGNDVYYHDSCRNYNSIGIEMCSRKVDAANASSPYDPDWYFLEGTMDNTAALVRELMMKYSVPLENVVRHNDVSHKTCPAPFVNDFSAWQDFLNRIGEQQTGYDGTYQAEVTATQLNVRGGPGQTYEIVDVLEKGDVVTVLEERGTDGDREGRWARTDGGWVSYPYLCRLG